MRLAVIGLLLCVPLPPDLPTPKQKFEELLERYGASTKSYVNSPRSKLASAEFLKLAREHPEDPAALDALAWVASHSLFDSEAEQAMGLLARDHVKSERLGPILREIDKLYGDPFGPMERLFRAALRDSPHREIRGWACLALARYLVSVKEKSERDLQQHSLFLKGEHVPFVPEPKLKGPELEKLIDEAASLYERVIKEYEDIGKLGEAARTDLFELRNVTVGKVALEIEGEDVDGVRFKLSDNRGKVVVLTFSGNWCGPCRAMYPHERGLVARLKDRPFAVLSVNTDEDKGTLRKSIGAGEITWRCWWEGGIEGPICSKWNVSSFPAVYVIDRDGVIRYKNIQGRLLDEAVDTLLEVMKAAKP